jgi:tripartite ATP-independent transporter DctM subunit
MGRIAVPEMVRHGYSVKLSVSTVAAAGTLGPLIPPSILLILYGIFVQQPIGKLFLGGLAMGILPALAYVVVVLLWAKLVPDAAPRPQEKPSFEERMGSLRETLPALILVLLVFGGLFGGIFTPSEAGGVGATLSVVIAFARRGLSLQGLRKALEEAMTTTCVIFLIAIGASMLVRLLALSGADQLISDIIIESQPSRIELFLIIAALYLFLGMFLEPVGTMLLTIPILYPVLGAANINLLWFGMILIKFLEIGMLTPPVGLNVYVIKSVVGSLCETWTIFKAVSVFLLADVVIVAIAMMFPEVVLYFTTLVK